MNRFITVMVGSAFLSGMALIFISQFYVLAAHAQTTYEVFIAQGEIKPVPGVTVYHVKQGDNVLAVINQQLKADRVMDEDTGAGYVTQQLQDALMAQMTGLTKAAKYRLKYFPAIVKDGRYVIYGTTNPKAFNGIAH